jgi:hypothetical protein
MQNLYFGLLLVMLSLSLISHRLLIGFVARLTIRLSTIEFSRIVTFIEISNKPKPLAPVTDFLFRYMFHKKSISYNSFM